MFGNDDWLSGYAWPVRRAHEHFVASNCFDSGSLFHSDRCAHGTHWQPPAYSIKVLKVSGAPGVKAATTNAALELTVELHDWDADRKSRLRTTNGALIALLRTGNMPAFLRAVEEL
jgi:hypothetical protein